MFKESRRTAIAGVTSTAINLTVGFKAKRVSVFNVDTAGSLEWLEGMPAGAGIKVVTAGAQTYITSNGITVDERKITIGSDATNATSTTTTTGTGSKGSYKLTLASVSGLSVGHYLSGAGIQADSRIESISGLIVTLSKPLSADMSGGAVARCNLIVEVS